MKKTLLLTCMTAGLLLNAQNAGEIISYEKKADLTPSFMAQHFIGELGGQHLYGTLLGGIIGLIDQSKYKLEAYKIVYWTPDYNGKLVRASGLVMFPKVNYKLSTIIYCHGTTTKKDVPSNLSDSAKLGFILPTLFAVSEYIVVAPDYIGLGDSEGYHPYMNSKTEATATLDMTKAANKLLEQLGTKRYDEYFLTGYSQGAHAAMATLKSNNLVYKDFNFKYASLGGGPYDMSDTTLNIGVLQKLNYSSFLLSNLINGCQTVGYKIYNNSYKEIIAPAYQESYKKNIIDNPDTPSTNWGPTAWRDMVYPSFSTSVENNQNHPLRKCLQENDVYNWYNTTSTHMINSKFDNIIPYQNTDKTKATMRSKFYNIFTAYSTIRGTVDHMNYGVAADMTHIVGAIPYLASSLMTFTTLRNGGFLNGNAKQEISYAKNSNNKEIIDYNFSGSPLDTKLNILGTSNFKLNLDTQEKNNQREISRSEKSREINLNDLSDGTHLIQITTDENKTWTIPYFKAAPEEIPSSSVIKTSTTDKITLDLHALTGLKKINLFDEKKQLINSFETNQLVNGELIINIQKLIPQTYTFEFVLSPVSSLVTQYKKTTNTLVNTTQFTSISIDGVIKIVTNKNLREARIYDMSGKLVWNADHINSKEISSSPILNKGVYSIIVLYTDGTSESKKIIQK